jgi:hypothetical protein
MMKKAKTRFPNQTPSSKEEYYCREIFDGYFTSPSAALTVPVGSTIACSTRTAFRWSKEFAKTAEPSGGQSKMYMSIPRKKRQKIKIVFFKKCIPNYFCFWVFFNSISFNI